MLSTGLEVKNVVGEQVNSSVSPPRPDPRLTVSGNDGEGNKISANVSQVHSRDPPPHPGPILVNEGHHNNS